ncbi:unnamed protein product [Rotaria sp. Silwood2]|nr:unnamed protein product [Rotaria sp. Silwood2]CAF2514004.1 unnamed protein product [Rotaria sp. Silwood2]CAF2723981.1 unnamed protein product [Rotaria sp. Silwood2]CAF2876858.1 unnamed protein product [Rotaria sp. Silwood2]
MISLKLINLCTERLLLKKFFCLTIHRFDQEKTMSKNLLEEYKKKRDFKKTREPKPAYDDKNTNEYRFVVQEHHASILHFDFRLEYNGVMKRSIPKGPSLNPRDKRLAIMVEDHPIPYMNFEGKIPEGEYGAGLRTWDIGTYEPLHNNDIDTGLEQGKLTFRLHGKKLKGEFHMIRSRFGSKQRANQWLLIKKKDEFANEHFVLERILDYGSRRDLQSPTATTNNKKRQRQSTTKSPKREAKKR